MFEMGAISTNDIELDEKEYGGCDIGVSDQEIENDTDVRVDPSGLA